MLLEGIVALPAFRLPDEEPPPPPDPPELLEPPLLWLLSSGISVLGLSGTVFLFSSILIVKLASLLPYFTVII